ncbi:MAG: glycosyltransferase family A protein [Candidatus Thorarchaeota archaeon]
MQQSSKTVPFHRYCEFCTKQCEDIASPSQYILITNAWNEAERVEETFRSVITQSKLPNVWLWMEDGSTDETYERIVEQSKQHPEIEVWIEQMPKKRKGNFYTLGRTHQEILSLVKDRINEKGIDYFGVLDADTLPCPNYFARMCRILDENSDLGAISGYPIGEWDERIVAQPMNTGKLVRWPVVDGIEKYWDFCPDTFYNIKTLANGYDVDVFKVPVYQNRPSTNLKPAGAFRMGRVAYYGGRPFWAMLYRALRRLVLKQHGTMMLRGWLTEYIRGTWHCDDPDVIRFFKEQENPLAILQSLLQILRR